jgi:hypothetical protein
MATPMIPENQEQRITTTPALQAHHLIRKVTGLQQACPSGRATNTQIL